jgi:hypothetical protein
VNVEAPLALATTDPNRPGLEIRVNFGVFAGRGATPAEIDDLARELIPAVGEVSIVAEERHELSGESEAALNQVRVEVEAERLPDSPDERDALITRLVGVSERWAEACIADRHAEVSEL